MDGYGTQDARGTHANPVPPPAGPPDVPAKPAFLPQQARPAVADWLNEPRPDARPGIWRYGYSLPKAARARGKLSPVTVIGLVIPLVVGMIVWSFWKRGVIPYQWTLLRLFTPDDWWWGGTLVAPNTDKGRGVDALVAYNGIFFVLLGFAMSRLGSWPQACRYYFEGRRQPARALLALLAALLTLSFVFPSAFPGVGWDPAPIVDPIFLSPTPFRVVTASSARCCSSTACTPPWFCSSPGPSPASAAGGRWPGPGSPSAAAGRARGPCSRPPMNPGHAGPNCARPGSTRRRTSSPPRCSPAG